MKQLTIGGLLFLLFVFTSTRVLGQGTDPVYLVSPTGDSILVKAVPLSVITDSIEKAFDKIKKIENNLLPDPALAKFDSIYDSALDGLETEKTKIFETNEHSSIRKIDEALSKWKNYSHDLTDIKDNVSNRIKILEEDGFEVEVLIETWGQTLRSAREGGLPANVLTNVTEFISRTKALKREIKAEKTEAFRKQNKITELLLLVDEVNDFLKENRHKLQSDYLIQDSPPIWAAVDSTASPSLLKAELKNAVKNSLNSLTTFYTANEGTLIFHLIILILLWIGFYFLYKQANAIEGIEENEQLGHARFVISRYGISALIISLFISVWLYPIILTTVNDLIQFLYIIIAIYFLPLYINKKLRLILYAILILFLFNEVQVLFPGKTFFSRLNLLAEGVIAAWIVFKMVSKDYIIAAELKRRNWGILLKIAPFFFVFLGVAIIGNVFGFLNLSLLLTNTVVNALFNLIILILVVMVVNRTIAILLRTPFMQSSNIIKNDLPVVEKRITIIIQVISVFLWLRSILVLIGINDAVGVWFTEIISTTWQVGDDSTIEFGGIINFFLAILITVIAYKVTSALLKDEFYPRVRLPRGVPGAISMIIGYLIAGYGLFISITVAGVDLSSFGLIAGALGVGIGFGLQGIVANFIAGIVIAFERPIQVGDTIEIDTVMGDVLSIGVRSVTIRTFSGSEVIVPNSSLITNDVINWTLTDRRKRRDIEVSVAYGSDPHQVLELIKKVANDHPDVLKVPAPWALFDGFGDSSLNFRIRIWTTMDNGVSTKSAVAINIYDALREAGIEIPFPQQDLHLRSIDPAIQQFNSGKNTPATKKQPTRRKPSSEKETKKKNESNTNEFTK